MDGQISFTLNSGANVYINVGQPCANGGIPFSFNSSEGEFEALREERDALKKQVEKAELELSETIKNFQVEKESILANFEITIQKSVSDEREVSRQTDKLERKIVFLETEIARHKETVKELKKRATDAEKKVAEAEKKVTAADKKLADAEKKAVDAETKLTDAVNEVAGCKQELERVRAEAIDIEQKHIAEKEELVKAVSDSNELFNEATEEKKSVEEELNRLRIRMNAVGSRQASSGGLLVDCEEHDLFEGEIVDYILEIITDELNNRTNEKSRKADALRSILAANKFTGEHAKRREALRELVSKYKTFADCGVALKEIGFEVIKSKGGKHPRLRYCCDDRYVTTVSSTPSDCHSNKNQMREMINYYL